MKGRWLWRGLIGVAAAAMLAVPGGVAIATTLVAANEHRSHPTSPTVSADGRPPNDNFADAEALIGGAGSRRGTNVEATLETAEPEHYPYARIPARNSVWFKWSAPWSGWATFHTCGSRFDSVLAVYIGAALTQLFQVADDRYFEDTCEPGSRVHFKTSVGGLYWIAVAGHTGRGESTGVFTLVWNRYVPPRPGGSCFFSRKGVRRWCIGQRYGNSWTPCDSADVYKNGSRYFVSEGHTEFGYVRPAGRGRWRAMVAVEKGWARDGTIVRASNSRWLISSRGRTLGFARGPYPVAVGAYRLLAGNC